LGQISDWGHWRSRNVSRTYPKGFRLKEKAVPRIDLCSYKLLGSFGLGLAFCPELFPLAFRIRTLPRVGKCLNSQFGSVPHWLYTTDVPSRQAGYTRKRISLMYLKSIILLDMVRRGGYGWSSSLISEERRRFCRGRKGLKKPAFCETKPFVMCGKQGISSCCERRWKHYRKMTNGFVSVRNAPARSHYPAGLETARGGLLPSQGSRLSGKGGKLEPRLTTRLQGEERRSDPLEFPTLWGYSKPSVGRTG